MITLHTALLLRADVLLWFILVQVKLSRWHFEFKRVIVFVPERLTKQFRMQLLRWLVYGATRYANLLFIFG